MPDAIRQRFDSESRGSIQNVIPQRFPRLVQRLGPVRLLLAAALLSLAACAVAPRPPNAATAGDTRSAALPQAASTERPNSAPAGAAPDSQEPATPTAEAQESAGDGTANESDAQRAPQEEAIPETEPETSKDADKEEKKDRRSERIVLDTVYDDRRVGNDQTAQVEAELGLVQDEKLDRYVRDIAMRLLRYAPTRPFEWEFKIVDQTVPNAFALPGGKIYVSRGLLALVETEDELAGVLGHEITHSA